MYLNFCFCFFAWYFSWIYEFCKLVIKKKKKKHGKIVLLAKSKLNSLEVLISKALIDSNISHDEFVLINNALKKYDEMKEGIIEIYQIF